MLNGQKLQGPYTAEEVNYMLKNKGMEDKYVKDKIVELYERIFIKIVFFLIDSLFSLQFIISVPVLKNQLN